jgi:hypothetical protein
MLRGFLSRFHHDPVAGQPLHRARRVSAVCAQIDEALVLDHVGQFWVCDDGVAVRLLDL